MPKGASSTAQVKTATKTCCPCKKSYFLRHEGGEVCDEGTHLAAKAHILADLLHLRLYLRPYALLRGAMSF